jgi:hypothetical protein
LGTTNEQMADFFWCLLFDKASLLQYTALTLVTGFFFSRYALFVTPINYRLSSVNMALFGSSAWHLGCKLKVDYANSTV